MGRIIKMFFKLEPVAKRYYRIYHLDKLLIEIDLDKQLSPYVPCIDSTLTLEDGTICKCINVHYNPYIEEILRVDVIKID